VTGEIVRIRADVASNSRLAGVIVEIPVDREIRKRLLIGSFVEARIDAGRIDGAIRVPRRALRDNGRVWVVDSDSLLQVRNADVLWENDQSLLLSPVDLQPGDRIVVSRVTGMVPGAEARVRPLDSAGSNNG
jgi:multidrug efflux pump subunit AcrA (membrane-fusion protein)